jgi:hypothetical protein
MDPVTEAGTLLRGRMDSGSDSMGGAVRAGRDRLASGIQEHPVRTVLMVAGAGILVGLFLNFLRSRRSSD